MSRRARNPGFLSIQLELLHEPRVEPITRLVETLRAQHPDRWVPWVAPYHGGVKSTVLFLLRDPGHRTTDSQMIGFENDDPTAELAHRAMTAAGLELTDVLPWNIYPWYRVDQESGLRVRHLDEGIEPLRQVLELLPNLQSVVVGGADARKGWSRFASRHPDVAARYRLYETRHPSRRGITNGGRQTRAEGERQLVEALTAAQFA